MTSVTLANTTARVKQLAEARTHGERFFCTGGGHACTDDVFKAMEYKTRKQTVANMEKEKKQRKLEESIEQRALAVYLRKQVSWWTR